MNVVISDVEILGDILKCDGYDFAYEIADYLFNYYDNLDIYDWLINNHLEIIHFEDFDYDVDLVYDYVENEYVSFEGNFKDIYKIYGDYVVIDEDIVYNYWF